MEKKELETTPDDSAQIWAYEDYHFYGQRSNEKVMDVKRQHIIILLPIFVIVFVSFIIPYFMLRLHLPSVTYFVGGYALVAFLFFYHSWYGYQHSLTILSSERIVNVFQRGFFQAKITEAELSRIQDVSSDIKGVLPTMFGYGDVTIRTASESILTIKNIGSPYDFQQAIVRALKNVKHGD